MAKHRSFRLTQVDDQERRGTVPESFLARSFKLNLGRAGVVGFAASSIIHVSPASSASIRHDCGCLGVGIFPLAIFMAASWSWLGRSRPTASQTRTEAKHGPVGSTTGDLIDWLSAGHDAKREAVKLISQSSAAVPAWAKVVVVLSCVYGGLFFLVVGVSVHSAEKR